MDAEQDNEAESSSLAERVPISTLGSSPMRGRIGRGGVAFAMLAALAIGVASGILIARGSDSSSPTLAENSAIAATAGTDDGHMVPRWMPDGLELQTADTSGRAATPCLPSALERRQAAGLDVPLLVPGLTEVGPDACAMPSTNLLYLSRPARVQPALPPPALARLEFVRAGPGDIRSPAATSAIVVRGRDGLVFQSGGAVWLAWAEGGNTFFISASGLSVDTVVRVAESVAPVNAAQWSQLRSLAPPVMAGTSNPQSQVAACLQANGLDAPDASNTSTVVAKQYPVQAAQRAWQACRDEYVQASGIPASPLSVYDCMAGHGWIMAVITGPPADGGAYGAALQKMSAGSSRPRGTLRMSPNARSRHAGIAGGRQFNGFAAEAAST